MKLYVGTYAKYNSGSIKGAWLDLDDYKDATEFEAACRRLHKDERDPELMFQDVETDPGADWQEGLYSESSIPREYWDLKKEAEASAKKAKKPTGAKARDKAEQERLCAAYMAAEGYTQDTDRAKKRYDYWHSYYAKRYRFVELSDGVILTIEIPTIQTRFCCGEDDRGQGGEGYGTMAFANKYLENKRTEIGFKSANLDPFDKTMVEACGRTAWARAKGFANGEHRPGYWGSYSFVPALMQGAYTNGRIYLGNANNPQRYEKVARYLADEEFRKMRREYMAVRTAFKKRLDAYWKRFGASKIHTWTYWTEA